MGKFIIVEKTEESYNAGSKAPNDILRIVSELDYIPLFISSSSSNPNCLSRVLRQFEYFINYHNVYKKIENDSIIMLQHPFYKKQLGRYLYLKKLKIRKKVRIISVIHDIRKLRNPNLSSYCDKEFNQMVELADVIVVHNQMMKRYCIKKGISESKIVVLEIFDYLAEYKEVKKVYSEIINIAGNLNPNKVGYLSGLSELCKLTFNLYGSNLDKSKIIGSNINYIGSFNPDDLPNKFNGGFGLVWDGDSIETCSGYNGQYLRYNNPHKLSLYLAAEIPVIIWANAAEAKFIVDNKCGFTVESLFDIEDKLNKIGEYEYYEMNTNCHLIGQKIRNGYYTKKAVESAEMQIYRKKSE